MTYTEMPIVGKYHPWPSLLLMQGSGTIMATQYENSLASMVHFSCPVLYSQLAPKGQLQKKSSKIVTFLICLSGTYPGATEWHLAERYPLLLLVPF